MSSKDILQHYFELSDTSGQNSDDFEKLIALFADDAEIIAADGSHTTEIRSFFEGFFSKNVELHHLFNIDESNIVDWAVVGRRKNGQVFALSGQDEAEIVDRKIIRLLVKTN